MNNHTPYPRPETLNPSATDAELATVINTFLRQLGLPVSRAQGFLKLTREALGEDVAASTPPLLYTERAVQQIFALMTSLERYMHARQTPLRLRRVDLNLVWQDALKQIQPLLSDRCVELTHDALPVVQGDRAALLDIFVEYLSNALKFTRTRELARLHLCVQETDTAFHLGLQDNGVGFDPRQEARLFELFARGHPSTSYEGAGLGLAVVRRLMERVGGRAWGESVPDQGSTFWIAWPKEPSLDAAEQLS